MAAGSEKQMTYSVLPAARCLLPATLQEREKRNVPIFCFDVRSGSFEEEIGMRLDKFEMERLQSTWRIG